MDKQARRPQRFAGSDAASPLAHQVTRDKSTSLKWVWSRVCDFFTDLEPNVLRQREELVLETLDWCLPMGAVYQTYTDALFNAANESISEDENRLSAPDILTLCDDLGDLSVARPGHANGPSSSSSPPRSPTCFSPAL
jgi:hypothetical protein